MYIITRDAGGAQCEAGVRVAERNSLVGVRLTTGIMRGTKPDFARRGAVGVASARNVTGKSETVALARGSYLQNFGPEKAFVVQRRAAVSWLSC